VKLNMQSRKRFLTASVGALAFTGTPASAVDSFVLRMSFAAAPTTAWGMSAARWAAAVDRRSNGRLKIELYPNGQLANEQASIQGLTTGVVDLRFGATVFLESLIPQLSVFTLPFMFKDTDAVFRVVDGPIGNEIFSRLESKGMIGLFWGTSAFRELETVSKPIRVPEDMKGLRFRSQGGAVSVGMVRALGAIPLTVDFSEIYVSLAQHTVDAIDSTPDAVLESKFDSVVKHVAMTNHVFVLQPMIGSKSKIESLPADLQRILKEEGKAILPFWRSSAARSTAAAIETLKSKGVAFTEVDYPAFRKAMDPVYASLQSSLGDDLIQRVSRSANGA
jgi:tripartite ATP-independent transporter DctP family solute receptor